MSRRSEQRRHARREKMARKWATYGNAPRVTGSRGVAKKAVRGVLSEPFPKTRQGLGDI